MHKPADNISIPSLRRQALEKLGAEGRIFRAPGRVNLIGEHTDYNQGLVMPAAINRFTYVAAQPLPENLLRLESGQFDETYSADLSALKPLQGWGNYVLGMAAGLIRQGYSLRGARLCIQSEIPFGAGLSSSAALEIATGLAMLAISQSWPREGMDMVWSAHYSDHHYVGVLSGIMDQFIATFGLQGCALMFDCRSLEWDPIDLPEDCELVICNTGVKHALASSEYNQRRRECQEGVERLQRRNPAIASLRDVSLHDFERWQSDLPDVVLRRCRHIITENQRVLDAREAFRNGDLEQVGELFAASHRSMRDDYEISCPELDLMVELAGHAPGFMAGRMTGGGFGGSTVNLVRRELTDQFIAAVAAGYDRAMGRRPEIWAVEAVEGGGELKFVDDQELLIRAAT